MPTTRNQQKKKVILCGVCKAGIKARENACRCIKCNGVYHASCQNIRPRTFQARWNQGPTCGGYLDIDCKACIAKPNRKARRSARNTSRDTSHDLQPDPQPEPHPEPQHEILEQEPNTSVHSVHAFYGRRGRFYRIRYYKINNDNY